VPQIAFRNKDQAEWVWLAEPQLTDPSAIDAYRTPESLIQVVGPSQDDLDRLVAKLKTLGITFNQQGPLPQPARSDGTILTRLASKIDGTIQRAIGKIAFNYVAYTHGAAFALRRDFDEYRDWVRLGAMPSFGVPVVVVSTPVLADDSTHWRQTTGHIVTFDRNKGEGLFAQVSLFNDLNYKILMCLSYSGLLHDVRTGHHFGLKSRTTSKLKAITVP
jgi:hypothetical protein